MLHMSQEEIGTKNTIKVEAPFSFVLNGAFIVQRGRGLFSDDGRGQLYKMREFYHGVLAKCSW